MGHQHSSSAQPSKKTLAEKRYQVRSGMQSVKRRSTRKMGNVTLSGRDLQPTTDCGNNASVVESPDKFGELGECESSATLGADNAPRKSEVDERLLPLYPQQSRQVQKQTATSSSKHFGVRSGQASTSPILLTRTERVLIENSWKRSRKIGVESVGSRIFLRVLNAQPDIKFLFGLEKIPQGRLKYDPIFRKHASLLTTTLSYIVKNLPYPEKLAQHFQTLGRKHCKAQAKAFKEAYWDSFAEMITQAISVNQMRKGFDDERALRKRFSTSLMGISRSSTASVNTTHSNPTCSPYAIVSERSMPTMKPVVGRIQRGPKSGSVPKSVSYLDFEREETGLSADGSIVTSKLRPEARPSCFSPSSSSVRSASWCPQIESGRPSSGDGERVAVAARGGCDNAGYFTPSWSPVLGLGAGRHYHSLSVSAASMERPLSSHCESRRRSSGRGVLEKRYASLPTCEFLGKRDNVHSDDEQDDDDESVCTAGVELRIYDEFGSLSTAASALQLEDEVEGVGEGGEDMFATPKASTASSSAPFGTHRHSAGSIINHHHRGDGFTGLGMEVAGRSPSPQAEMSSTDANRRLSAQ